MNFTDDIENQHMCMCTNNALTVPELSSDRETVESASHHHPVGCLLSREHKYTLYEHVQAQLSIKRSDSHAPFS